MTAPVLYSTPPKTLHSPRLPALSPADSSSNNSGSDDTSEHSHNDDDDDDNDAAVPWQECARIAKAAAALDNAGNDMFERGEYERAMATYTRALKLKRRTLTLGQQQPQQPQQPQSTSSKADTLLASVATSINNISYLRQRSGASPEETMQAYRDALRIKQDVLGRDDLSVGKTLNNIGSVHFSVQQFDQAMEAYAEAKDIMVSNLGPKHLDVATVHSNIGDVHLAKGQSESARERYSEALAIRWSQLGDRDPKVIRLLEKIASIEMEGTSERLSQPQYLDRTESDVLYSDDERFRSPVQHELEALRQEVDDDLEFIERIKRDLSIDMVKDKLHIIKGMREAVEKEEEDLVGDDTLKCTLTGNERKAALSSVRERLASFRGRAEQEETEELPPSPTSNRKKMEEGIDALRRLRVE